MFAVIFVLFKGQKCSVVLLNSILFIVKFVMTEEFHVWVLLYLVRLIMPLFFGFPVKVAMYDLAPFLFVSTVPKLSSSVSNKETMLLTVEELQNI